MYFIHMLTNKDKNVHRYAVGGKKGREIERIKGFCDEIKQSSITQTGDTSSITQKGDTSRVTYVV